MLSGTTTEIDRLRLGFAIVLLSYFAVYGVLLWVTNGLPYVFDNNETFSSIVHARNMLMHGIGQTFGLTDESVGLTSQSNPYLYTHQGNFPRFFALLIYWLGARSGEAQIFVTTFTVGIAAIYFAYDLVARRGGVIIGVVFCTMMMTDYIMIAQWQVNTWRVWHMFFFFLPLVCVDRVAKAKRPRFWLIALIAIHACLFYYELIFAAFTAATTGLFAILTIRNRPRLTVAVIAAQTCGMLIGIGILIAQLWAYFGWDDFVTDLKLTFLARNEALGDGSRAVAEKFMTEHQIAFWYNINETAGLRQPAVMLEKFFSFTLGIYTPALVAIAVVVTIGVAIHRISTNPTISQMLRTRFVPLQVARATIAGLFLVYSTLVIIGIGTSTLSGNEAGYVEMTLLGLFGLFITSRLASGIPDHAAGRVALSVAGPQAVTILAAGAWLIATDRIYDSLTPYWGNFNPIWSAIMEPLGSSPLQLTLLFVGWTAARIAAGSISPTVLPIVTKLERLLAIVVSGWIAYAIVYLLSPGYLVTGYLHRFVPFVTFANLLSLAIGVAAILAVIYGDIVSLRRQPWWRALWWPRKNGVRASPLMNVAAAESAMLLASIAVAVVLPVYWIIIQSKYIQRVPPDEYGFLSLLKKSPFKGASFVVNAYAAPIAVATGQWAYYDPLLGYNRIETIDGEKRLVRDFRYLWLADRDTNTEYLRPDYFLCVMAPDIGTVIRPDANGCSQLPLVRSAGETVPGILTTELVARDGSDRDRWAILRLDWQQPGSSTAQ